MAGGAAGPTRPRVGEDTRSRWRDATQLCPCARQAKPKNIMFFPSRGVEGQLSTVSLLLT